MSVDDVEPLSRDPLQVGESFSGLKLSRRIGKIRTGDGRRCCDMGPLVTRAHGDLVASYLDAAPADGASLVVDDRTVEPDGEPGGFWLGPSLLDHVTPSMPAHTDEIFGPVLCAHPPTTPRSNW